MEKKLVETSGDFQYHCPESMQLAVSHRPSVVKMTTFLAGKVATGTLKLLADLKPEATDQDFDGYWKECEGDSKFAVESFKSKFGLVPEPKQEPKPKKVK
jgi:hypothetical protein